MPALLAAAGVYCVRFQSILVLLVSPVAQKLALLKLVLEVAGTSLVRIEHCKSQRLVLSVKGYIDKLESVPVRARGLC